MPPSISLVTFGFQGQNPTIQPPFIKKKKKKTIITNISLSKKRDDCKTWEPLISFLSFNEIAFLCPNKKKTKEKKGNEKRSKKKKER